MVSPLNWLLKPETFYNCVDSLICILFASFGNNLILESIVKDETAVHVGLIKYFKELYMYFSRGLH